MEMLNTLISELSASPDPYVRSLALVHPLREPALVWALNRLNLGAGARGLDLGCGIGLPALAAARSANVEITGVDLRQDFIDTARDLSSRAGLANCLGFIRGDAAALDLAPGSFDWAWSVDCVNYAPGLGQAALEEMARMLRPGGVLALMAWSSQRLLPGYPVLEAALNTTAQGLAPNRPGMDPARDFMATPKVLAKMGFSRIRAATYAVDIQAPLDPGTVRALADIFQMRWGDAPQGLDPEETSLYRCITAPDLEVFGPGQDGYYGFFTYTLFSGVK